jgi:hypothetical protein
MANNGVGSGIFSSPGCRAPAVRLDHGSDLAEMEPRSAVADFVRLDLAAARHGVVTAGNRPLLALLLIAVELASFGRRPLRRRLLRRSLRGAGRLGHAPDGADFSDSPRRDARPGDARGPARDTRRGISYGGLRC